MTLFVLTETYRPCLVCQAPIMSPFPDTWTVDLIKEGPPGGPVTSWITPHAEQCDAPVPTPDPGIAVRVPGQFVRDFTPTPAQAAQQAVIRSGPGHLKYGDSEWVTLGTTESLVWDDTDPPDWVERADDPVQAPYRPGEAAQ